MQLDDFRHASALFADMEDWYARFRPGIPDEVRDWILAWIGELHTLDELLDLGTGTGQVIQALGPKFYCITGVDPSRAMLDRAAERCAQLARRRTIRWIEATAEIAAAMEWPNVRLVTICRAFHWMDQIEILESLSRTTPSKAGVVVFGDSSLWNSPEPWARQTKCLIQSFLGEERRARKEKFTHHDIPYAEILAATPFKHVEEVTIDVTRRWSIDAVLGYLYSTTFAAPDLFGEKREEFERSLMDLLRSMSEDGFLTEQAKFVIQAAQR